MWKPKTSKNIHDVRKLVQWGTSVPQPIWLAFRSWKSMKFGRRVPNLCLSWFMVKTSGYDSPRTNQGPMRRTFSFWGQKHCLGGVHSRRELTERVWIDGALTPSVNQHLDILDNAQFEPVSELTYGCVARKGGRSSTHRRIVGRGLVYEGWDFLHVLS